MQSSRQKKKASQQKKRYHERAKGKPGGAEHKADRSEKPSATEIVEPKKSNAGKEQPKEAKSYFEFAVDNRGTNLSGASGSGPVKRSGSHEQENERTVEASLEEAARKEEEEQLQQRLIQLLNRPIQHAPSPHPPSLTSISSTSNSTQDTAPSPPSTSFLTLDCASLAESLSTLPLHDRLKIDSDLLELSDLPPLDDSNAGVGIWTQEQLQSGVDLTTCSKRNRPDLFEFKKMAASLTVSRDKQEEDQGGHHDGGSGKPVAFKPETSKASDDDIELDRLLGRNLIVRSRTLQKSLPGTSSSVSGASTASETKHDLRQEHTSLGIAPPDTDIRQSSTKVTSVLSTSEPVLRQSTSGNTTKSDKEKHMDDTEELDDMLDELLS